MEITKTKEEPEKVQPVESTDAVDEKNPQENDNQYQPFENVNDADTDNVKKIDGLLNHASEYKNNAADLIENEAHTVNLTAADKSSFLDAIVTGDRFTSTVYLYNGRLKLKLRSRSVEETEAILAYMHRNGIAGNFTTKADVSNAALEALLVAQVAELGDVVYPEMKKPLRYVDTVDGIQDPGWIQDIEIWRRKPESLVAAIGDALVEFEAKYWAMVRASRDENFWNPGGSTEK